MYPNGLPPDADAGREPQDGAFEQALAELRGAVMALLRRRLRSENVDDAAQETFLRALRYQHVDDRDELRALLLRIADNVVNDHYRRSNVRAVEVSEDDAQAEPVSQLPGPEQIQSSQQDWQRVKHAILHLPPRCRSAFLLHRFSHLSYKEIAERHGTSVRTVEHQVATALSACRLALGEGQRR